MPSLPPNPMSAIRRLLRQPEWSAADFLFLDSGTGLGAPPHRHKTLGGFGVMAAVEASTPAALPEIDRFLAQHRGRWIFGHLSYAARLLSEPGLNHHEEAAGFAPVRLFVPEVVVLPEGNQYYLLHQDDGSRHPLPCEATTPFTVPPPQFTEEAVMPEADYHAALSTITQHLRRGDIYEMNYCIPFRARGRFTDPAGTWMQMQDTQQSPFGGLYRHGHHWLLCCSPERWLTRSRGRIYSQPIKGTARRDADPLRDERLKTALSRSEKEQAENVMIVDLVRNDLGRIAETGTVQVDELYGLYTFPAVHQLISTISARPARESSFTDLLRAAFPMGSMTGAPKISAMHIIEQTETFHRGLYSGSIGYIDPEGDFDFNVVIRSILYDEAEGTALFPAGSAITVHCQPEAEYRECLLKSNSMRTAMGLPLRS